MNVTWGLELSQQIYLKAGNKVYEIGGMWFAKLETPFEYLESQEFKLSYYVLPKNAELEAALAWRNQKINLIVSGIRSTTHLSGYFQVNTTIPEISRINVAVTHSRNNTENSLRIKNDVNLIFNIHHITGRSLWESTGLNVTADFEITSPSNTIQPLIGSLVMKNNDTTKLLNGSVGWRNERVAIEYHFENSHSYIKLLTPFEGMEESDFDYVVIGEADTLFLQVKSNFLKQYNYALLSVQNQENKTNSQIKVICPFIGQYNVEFQHSTVVGHFEEYFLVTQGDNNDLVAFQLYGDFTPRLEANVQASVKFLHHHATLIVENHLNPIASFLELHWDDNYVNGSVAVHYQEDLINDIRLNISSSLADDIYVKYKHQNTLHVFSASLPNGYKFYNHLNLINWYTSIENQLNIDTPNGNGSLFYIHDITEKRFNHNTIVRIGQNESRFTFYYNMNENIRFIDEMHAELNTPWYHPFTMNFSMVYAEADKGEIWKPSVYLKFDEDELFTAKAIANGNTYKSDIFVICNSPYLNKTVVNITYDFLRHDKNIKIILKRPENTYEIGTDFKGDVLNNLKLQGVIRKVETGQYYADIDVEYIIDKPWKIVKMFYKFPYTNSYYNLQLACGLELNVLKANANLTSTLPSWEKLSVDSTILLNPLNQYAIISFGRSEQFIKVIYQFNKTRNFTNGNWEIVSDFQSLSNLSAEFVYKSADQYQLIELNGVWEKRRFIASAKYNITTRRLMRNRREIALDSALKITYSMANATSAPFNIYSKMNGSLIAKPSGAEVSASFNTNLQSMQTINLIANYTSVGNGYKLTLAVDHNVHAYFLEHDLIIAFNTFEILANLRSPPGLFGNASGHLLCKRIGKQMDALLRLKRPLESYNFTLNTTWNRKFLGNFELNTQTTHSSYKGYTRISISGIESDIDVLFRNNNDNHKMEMHWITNDIEKVKFDLNSNLNWFEFEPLALHFNRNNRCASLYIASNYFIHVNGTIDSKIAKVDFLFGNLTGTIDGSHQLDTIDDLSLTYSLQAFDQKATIKVSNKVDEGILTTIEIFSTLRDLNEAKFESKIFRNKIEMGFNMQNYNFEFFVDKNVLNPMLKLLIDGDQTTPLSLLVHQKQLKALSHTQYGEYHFEILAVNEKYSVLYRRNHRNIFFADLYDIEIDGQLKFKSNFGSVIFEENKNFTIIFSLQYFPHKTFLFTIFNSTDTLLHVFTAVQLDQPLRMAKLEFRSVFHSLQMLSVSFLLNPLQELQLHFARRQYFRETNYSLILIVPSDHNETKFTIIFPVNERQQWVFSLTTNQSRVNFLLETPWQMLQHVGFETALKKSSLRFNDTSSKHLSAGFVKFHRNKLKVETIWRYSVTDTDVFIDWKLINSPFRSNDTNLHGIAFKGRYQLGKEIEGILDYHELENRGNLSLKFNDHISFMRANITLPSLLIGNLNVDFLLKDKTTGHIFLEIANELSLIMKGEDVNSIENRNINLNASFQDCQCVIELQYDHNNPNISLLTDFKVFDYILNIKSNYQANTNFTNGNFVAVVTNGYSDSEPKPDQYGAAWIINNKALDQTAKLAFQKNSDVSYIEVGHNFGKNRIESFGIIACGDKALKLNVEGVIKLDNTTIAFFVATPWENFRELTLKTNFIKNENSFEIQTNVGWPDKQNIDMYLLTTNRDTKSNLQLTFVSPFSKRLHITLDFDIKENQWELITFCTLGAKEIEFKGKIVPNSMATFDLKSPFAGYTTANFTTIFDSNTRTLLIYFQKEALTTQFNGIVNSSIENVYEIVLIATHPEINQNKPYAKIVLKLDSNNMKGTADVYWRNNEIDVDIGFNPKNMYLHIDSPFEPISNVRVWGKYESDVHSSNFDSHGVWNKAMINFSVSLIYQDNDFILEGETQFGKNYHGYLNYKSTKNNGTRLINFNGYYPSKSSDITLIFEIETVQKSINSHLNIKTPFEFIKHLNSATSIGEGSIHIDTLITIMDDNLILKFTTDFRRNHGNLTFALTVPQIESKLIIQSDISADQGYVQFHYEKKLSCDNLTIDYQIKNSELISHYKMFTEKANINHTVIVSCRNSTKNNKYAFLIDEYGLEYNYINETSTTIQRLYGYIPSLYLNKTRTQFTVEQKQYSIFATFNDNMINITSTERDNELISAGTFCLFKDVYEVSNNIVRAEDSYFIQSNVSDGKLWIYTSTYYTNNEKIVQIRQILTDSLKTNYSADIYVEKSLDAFSIDIPDFFQIHIQHIPNPELLLLINYYNDRNELKISLVPDNILLKICAPTLNIAKTESIIQLSASSENRQIDSYYYENSSLLFRSRAKLYCSDAGYIVNIDLYNKEDRIFQMSGEIDTTNMTKGLFELRIFDTYNTVLFILKATNPYVGALSIQSPFLQYHGITIEAGASHNSALLFVGSGPAKLHESLVVDPMTRHAKYLLKNVGLGKNENQLFLTQVEMTSNILPEYLKFQAKVDTNGSSVDFNGFFEIKSNLNGNLLVDTKFNINPSGVNTELHLNQPFIDSFHTFGMQLRMPFTYSANLNPRISINFQNNRTYLVYLTYQNISKECMLSGGYQWNSKKLHVEFSFVKMFIPSVYVEIYLPFESNNHYALFLKGLKDFNNDTDRPSYLKIFDKKYELIYALCYKPNKFLLKIDLRLSLHNYYVNLLYNNGNEKTIKAIVLYPNIPREIGFESTVSFQSPQQLKLLTKLSLPFEGFTFNYGELALLHDVILNNKNRTYIVECRATIDNFTTSVDLKAGLETNHVFFNFNTTLNKKQFAIKLDALGTVISDVNFMFIMKTPLKSLKFIQFYLDATNNVWQAFRVGMNYNSMTIVYIQFNVVDDEVSLSIDNMWRSLSMSYLYGNKIKFMGNLCWNTTDRKHSEVGAYLDYNKNITAKLTVPTREMRLNANYYIDEKFQYYYGQFYWNEHDRITLRREFGNQTLNTYCTHTHSLYSIELPFALFGIKNDIDRNSTYFEMPPSSQSTLSFHWGKEPHSQVSFSNLLKQWSIESKLSLPSLETDLVLKLSRTPEGTLPSQFKAEFEYSPESENKVELEIVYDSSSGDVLKMERRFSFRHPSSRMDYTLHFKTVRTSEYTTGDVVLEYVNYLIKQREKMKCSLRIGHEKFDVSGELRTTKSYVNFAVISRSETDHQDLTISLQVNDKEPLILNGKYNFQPMEPSLSISSSYGENRKYDLYAGIPSKREITMTLMHEIYNNQIIDGLFTMKLNTSHILWIKMLWKNELLSEFKTAVLEEYHDLRFIIQATGHQLIDVVNDEFGQRLFKDLSDLQKNISVYATNEKFDFEKRYDQFIQESIDSYHKNAFCFLTIQNLFSKYIPNLDKYVKVFSSIQGFFYQIYKGFLASVDNAIVSIRHVFDVIHNQINNVSNEMKAIRNLKADAKEILRKGIDEARKSLNEMDVLVIKLINKSDEIVSNIKLKCDEFLEPYLKLLDDLVIYVEQRLALFQVMILDILDTVQQYILNLRESREILQVYICYLNWLEELHLLEILDPIADTIEAILETIITDIEQISDEYQPYFYALSNAIFGNYQEINKLPPLAEFRECLRSIYQRILWIWNYHNLSEILKTHSHKLISDLDDFLSSFFAIENSNTDFENVLGQSDYIFRPDIGIIEITQPLPVEWEAFDEMPIFEQHPLYQKIKRKIENLLQLQIHRYVDFVNIVKSYVFTSPASLLSPPTNNIGMFIGTSHYITFDKKYYKFSGECSYLLASDFITNTFSLMVNYEMSNTIVRKRSVSVISEGQEVEISREYGVSLNGHRVTLPLILESLTVVQQNSEIIVENFKGMKTVCNLHYDFCTVKLSGWLFGKTGGLLGTLDNERSTDMTLPDGNQTSNLMEFVQSWQTGTAKCTDVNHANDTIKTNISPLSTTLFDSLCQVFFMNSNSPFGQCFSLVDPKPYYNICLNDMKDSVNPSICTSLAAYKAQCEGANFAVDMPEMCVHCSYGITDNEKILDGHKPKSMDVVFIIEDNCFTTNTFAELPKHVDENLIMHGFTRNRFAALGYGSNFNKPYNFIHGKRTWTDSNEKLNLILKTTTNFVDKVTGLDAINFAISKEFRPGVSKLLILMQCESRMGYEQLNRIHNMLGEKDITLHVLKKTSSPDTHNELLELGTNGHILYYTPGYNSNNLNVQTISKSMDRNRKEITDSYILLALSTNGTILNIHSEKNLKLKNIDHLWSHVISQSAKRSPCQKCKCVTNSDGKGKIECTTCLSPTVKQLLQEYESNGMKFSTNLESEESLL